MRLAILGLGHMGAAIAERLEPTEHAVAVWNRSPGPAAPFAARGLRVLERPCDTWQHAEVAITMLADDAAVGAVVSGRGGLLSGEVPMGCALIDMSTISAAASAAIATAAAARGLEYLRAPVSGNPSVVTAGKLGIIVSGPRQSRDRLEPVLRAIGASVFHVGDGEQARIVKLALNLMIGGTTQLLAEALVLSERNGIDRARLLEVVAASAIGSPYVSYKRESLTAGDYSSTFTARLLHKDLSLALEAGHGASVPLPVTALVAQLTESCIAQGWGDLDLTALVPALERASGASPDIRA
ncbi:MAG: NAD(P)-dependent oxidoreductase [Actinomycetota bacterium]|nr:NAD(P)-dependent oxidoreductase [Actinomycetota bacterium]